MDIANWISAAVFLIVAYFYIKKKILPKLALKRTAKTGQTVDAGQAEASPSPTLASLMQTGQFSGQTLATSRPVMCFDMRIVVLDPKGDEDKDNFERRIIYEANEMLLKYCSRGITPTLRALMLNSNCLMLYVTYAAP